MELPFRHTCQVYRINPRAEEIMKTHLENGEQRITLVNPAGLTLTRPRKNSITAIKKERRVKNEAVFCTPFFTSQA